MFYEKRVILIFTYMQSKETSIYSNYDRCASCKITKGQKPTSFLLAFSSVMPVVCSLRKCQTQRITTRNSAYASRSSFHLQLDAGLFFCPLKVPIRRGHSVIQERQKVRQGGESVSLMKTRFLFIFAPLFSFSFPLSLSLSKEFEKRREEGRTKSHASYFLRSLSCTHFCAVKCCM